MPTTTVRTIGSTGDYPDHATWEAACPVNLVTNDEIWQGQSQNQEFTGTGTMLAIAGQTTDATRYVELTTVAGASFADHAGKITNAQRYDASKGAAIRSSVSYGNVISSTTNYTRFSKHQVSATALQSYGMSFGERGAQISQVLMGGVGNNVLGVGYDALVKNCLIIQDRASSGNGLSVSSGSFTVTKLQQVTVVRPSNRTAGGTAFTKAYTNVELKNCAAFGFTTLTSGSGGVFTGNNNASNLAIGFGTSNQAGLVFADQFEQSSSAGGTHDFRTKTGANLIDNGADLSGSGVTIDIVGSSRSAPYDIGVWEVAGAGANTGTGAATLGTLTGTAVGALAISGTGARTLGTLTGTASGALAISATGAPTLGALTGAGTGALSIAGAGAGALGALAGSAVGTLAISATGLVTLGALTGVAFGGTDANTGTGFATLGALTGVAAGALSISATASVTLAPLTGSATGALAISGVASVTLGGLTGASTATLGITGAGARVLGMLTGIGFGTALVVIAPAGRTTEWRGQVRLVTWPAQNRAAKWAARSRIVEWTG